MIYSACGENEIRTRGTLIRFVGLANRWFQPLTHLSSFGFLAGAKIGEYLQTSKLFVIFFGKKSGFCGFPNKKTYLCSALLGKPKTKTDNNKRCQAPVGHEKT